MRETEGGRGKRERERDREREKKREPVLSELREVGQCVHASVRAFTVSGTRFPEHTLD